MISLVLGIYAELLNHYDKKWSHEKIDRKYQDWIDSEDMKRDFGYSDENFRRIPKRKIKNRAARKKHGY